MSRLPLQLSLVPLLPVTLAFVCGIALHLIFGSVWIIGACALAAVILALLRNYHGAAVAAAIWLGATDSYIMVAREADPTLVDRELYCSGDVVSVREGDNSLSMTIELDSVSADSMLYEPVGRTLTQIVVPSVTPDVAPGDYITLKCVMEPVRVMTDLPDELDPASFLIKKHVFLHAIVGTQDIVEVKKGKGLISWLYGIRRHMTTSIYRSRLSSGAKEFLNTVIVGDDSGMTDDKRITFASAGLSHVLALSGLHVGLIAMVVSLGLWPLYRIGNRRAVEIVTIVVLWLYAGISGFSPSVTRAVIMATVYLVGRISQQKSSPLNSLCLAALLILLFDPGALTSVGFQLSFAAVLAIILFSESLNPVSSRHRLLYNIVSLLTVTASAMIGTGLVAAIYFHTLPVYSLLANVASALLLPPLMACGLLLLLLHTIGVGSDWLCTVADQLYSWLEGAAMWISSIPGATIDRLYLPAWVVIPYTVTIGAMWLCLNKKRAIYGVMTCTCVCSMALCIMLVPGASVEASLYLPRTTYHTELVVYGGGRTLDIITDNVAERSAIEDRAQRRYADFMARRGIDSLRVMTSKDITDGMTYLRKNEFVSFGSRVIALADGVESGRAKVDYVVVSRGFRDEIDILVDAYSPDTVILAYNLHPGRAQKYINRCRELGVPYIWMRERPWKLQLHCSSR